MPGRNLQPCAGFQFLPKGVVPPCKSPLQLFPAIILIDPVRVYRFALADLKLVPQKGPAPCRPIAAVSQSRCCGK